jgi:lipoate-protein ligase A
MKTTQYNFSARYVDIDMARIVKENQDSDFIRVWWRKKHTFSTVYLITEKGMDRLRKVQMNMNYIKSNHRLSVSPSGGLTTFHDSYSTKIIYFMEITDVEFEKMFAKLREREERRWAVSVTAIN